MAKEKKKTTKTKKKSIKQTKTKNLKTSKRLFQNKKIRFQQKVNKQDIRPGMIITFDYTGISVTDPHPLVLVLNKRYLRKLHGINLNYCNYPQIIQIAKIVNDKISKKQLKLKQRYNIISPYGFYHTSIKPYLNRLTKSIYRTYTIRGIKNQKLIDYKFQATQGKNTVVLTSKDRRIQVKVTKQKVKKVPEKKTKKDTSKQIKVNKKQKAENIKKVTGLSSNGTVSNVKTVSNVSGKTVPSNNVKVIKKD